MKTLSRFAQISLFCGLAVASGLVLQCASDPAVTGDGGVVDSFVSDLGFVSDLRRDLGITDSIGPKADAAGSQVTRKVFKGQLDSSNDLKVCGNYSADDPPAVTLWLSGSSDFSSGRFPSVGTVSIHSGCIHYNGNLVVKGDYYRLVVVQ